MSTWLSAQQRRTLGTFAGSLGVGSATTIVVASLDLMAAVRVLWASSGPTTAPYSFQVAFQQGHNSGTWLSYEVFNVSTCAAVEFDAAGRVGLLTITNAGSTAYSQGAIYALPVQ